MGTSEDEMRAQLDGTFVSFDRDTGKAYPIKVPTSYCPSYGKTGATSEQKASAGRASAQARLGTRILTQDQRHQIQELHAHGIRTLHIAQAIGCTTSTARHWIRYKKTYAEVADET